MLCYVLADSVTEQAAAPQAQPAAPQQLLTQGAADAELLPWAPTQLCSSFWNTTGHRWGLGDRNRLLSVSFALCSYWMKHRAGSKMNFWFFSPQSVSVVRKARDVKIPVRTWNSGDELRRFKQHFTVYVRVVVVRKTGKQSEDWEQLHLQSFMCQQLLTQVQQANYKTYCSDLESTAPYK